MLVIFVTQDLVSGSRLLKRVWTFLRLFVAAIVVLPDSTSLLCSSHVEEPGMPRNFMMAPARLVGLTHLPFALVPPDVQASRILVLLRDR